MTPSSLLFALRQHGVEVEANDGTLRVRVRGTLSDGLRDALTASRDAILEHLVTHPLHRRGTEGLASRLAALPDGTAVIDAAGNAIGRAALLDRIGAAVSTSGEGRSTEATSVVGMLVETVAGLDAGLAVEPFHGRRGHLPSGEAGLWLDDAFLSPALVLDWARKHAEAEGARVAVDHLRDHPQGLLQGIAALLSGAVLDLRPAAAMDAPLDHLSVASVGRLGAYRGAIGKATLASVLDSDPSISARTRFFADGGAGTAIVRRLVLPDDAADIAVRRFDADGTERGWDCRPIIVIDAAGQPVMSGTTGELALSTTDHDGVRRLALAARRRTDGTLDLVASDAGVLIGGRRVLPVSAAAAAEGAGSVRAAHAAVRTGVDGVPRLVVWAVPNIQTSYAGFAADIGPRVSAVLPDHLDWRLAPVTTLPLANDGGVDEEQLATLACIDPASVRRWTASTADDGGILAIVPHKPSRGADYAEADLLVRSIPLAEQDRMVDERSRDGAPAIVQAPPIDPPVDLPLTLPGALRRAAAAETGGITLIDAAGGVSRMSYATLLSQSLARAGGLADAGIGSGDRVMIQATNIVDLFTALWACFMRGAVPLALDPIEDENPEAAAGALVLALADTMQPVAILASTAALPLVAAVFARTDRPLPLLVDIAALPSAGEWRPDVEPAAGDLALFFPTSGTTGRPKLVQQTHGNLILYGFSLGRRMTMSADDVSFNWMPLDHAGALAHFHVRDLVYAVHQVHADKAHILEAPLRWIDYLSQMRATITWSPNFSYRLVTDALGALDAMPSWDLTRLRNVTNGGEMISAASARAFIRALQPAGLPRTAMIPAWGMSETGSGMVFDFGFDPDGDATGPVRIGDPIDGAAMRIVRDDGTLCRRGAETGHFEVRGDFLTPGYLNDPVKNAESFSADGWLRTGDYARLDDAGGLFITGRGGNTIIVNGINRSCQEVEEAVERLAGIASGGVAACPLREAGDDTDAIALFVCIDSPVETDMPARFASVRGAMLTATGLAPRYIVPIAHEQFPRTSLGKIQRAKLRQQLEHGDFDAELRRGRSLDGRSTQVPNWFHARRWVLAEGREGKRPAIVWMGSKNGAAIVRKLPDWRDGDVVLHVAADADRSARAKALATALDAHPDCGAIIDATLIDLDRDDWLASDALMAIQGWYDAHRPGLRYLLASPGARRIDDFAIGSAAAAVVPALVRTAIAEKPWLGLQAVDIDPGDLGAAAGSLLKEAARRDGDDDVAWRGAHRFVARFERVRVDRAAHGGAIARKGLLLLAGRFDNSTYAVARWLARYDAAKLILADTSIDEGGVRLQRQAERLRADGASVETIGEHAWSAKALADAVAAAEAKHGIALSGVLYIAADGTGADGRIGGERQVVDLDPAGFGTMMRDRAAASLALMAVIAGRPDVPLIVFGSAAARLGRPGLAARAVDDAWLDRLAADRAADGGRAVSLEWGDWADAMGPADPGGAMTIATDAGMVSLAGALASGRSHLIIGLDGGQQAIAGLVIRAPEAAYTPVIVRPTPAPPVLLTDPFGRSVAVEHIVDPEPPRREDGSIDVAALVAARSDRDGAAPRGETEGALAKLWCTLLKIGAVERTDHFFAIGGNSILATQLMLRIADHFGVSLKLAELLGAPTIQALATLIDTCRGETVATEPALTVRPDPAARHQPFPLTDIQQAYWVGRSGVFDGGAIGTQCYFEIDGPPLDIDRFHRALNGLIERHPMLRMVVDEGGMQRILADPPAYRIALDDWRSLREEARHAALLAVREEMAQRVFRTDQWPLFELRAAWIGDGQCRLHVTIDTMIVDGSSYHILFNDLAALYLGNGDALPQLELTFRDYVQTIEKLKTNPAYAAARDYWLDRVDTLPPAPALPLVADPARIASPRIGRRAAALPPATWRALVAGATRHGVTPSIALAAIYAEALRCWSTEPNLTLNLTVFNRLPIHPQIGLIVGDFTATSLLEADGSEPTFVRRAVALQAQMWRDMDQRLFTGVEVLREIARRRHDTTGAAMPVVFTSALAIDGERGPGEHPPAQDDVFSYVSGRTSQVWLDFQVMENAGGLSMVLDVVEDIFPAGMVDDLFAAIHTLAARLADPAMWTRTHFELVPAAQIAVRDGINATAVEWPLRPLAAFVGDLASDSRGIAIIDGEREIDRATFSRWTRRLAAKLQRAGVKSGDLVAIEMDRGWRQVVAAAAICLSGGAYVPIDVRLPIARRRAIVDQTDARLVLRDDRRDGAEGTQDAPDGLAIGADLLDRLPDDTLAAGASLDDLAYVIFTSGSTGTPKGVMIDHRGAANTICDVNARLDVGSGDRVLALSALGFDLSVYDIFGVLGAGGAVVIPDADKAQDPEHWETLMRAHGVTLFNGVPALMQMLVDHLEVVDRPMPSTVRAALLSGDWIPVALPDRIRARCSQRIELYSLGGATEASIWSVIYPIGTVDPKWGSIPYGRPMANQRLLVLDSDMNDVPDAVTGDLYIGGIGLAKGYWRDETRTAGAFIHHPRTGDPLYRTGDRAAYRADGLLEFRGRVDTQVKLRGHRIELGEIETVIAALSGVRACVAHVHGADAQGRQIGAHMVLEDDADQHAMKAAAREAVVARLPSYMVPAFIETIDAVPLSANGKVDRGRLSLPRAVPPSSAARPIADVAAVRMAALWQEVLGQRPSADDDHFFDLGGNSISMLRLIARLRAQGHVVDVRRFFEAPTLRGMVETVAGQTGVATHAAQEPSSIPNAARRGRIDAWIATLDAAGRRRLAETHDVADADRTALTTALARSAIEPPADIAVPLSFEQERMWFGARLRDDGQYNLFQAMTLSDAIAPDALADALARIVARHEALRTRFVETDLGVRQIVLPADADGLFTLATLERPDADESALATDLLDREAAWRFDLTSGPLLRVTLARGADGIALVAFNLHHIACDGWSMANFLDELSLIGADRADALPVLSLSYTDFALWQRAWLVSAEYDRQIDHWRARLAQLPPLDLPPPPPGVAGSSGTIRFRIAPPATAALAGIGRAVGATMFTTLVAVLAAALHETCERDDFAIGTSVSTRSDEALEPLIGLFLNQVVLRADVAGNPSPRRLLERMRAVVLDAFAHRHAPFDAVVAATREGRERADAPLFNVLATLQNAPRGPATGLRVHTPDVVSAKFALSYFFAEMDDGIDGTVVYDGAQIDPSAAKAITERIGQLAMLFAERPDTPLNLLAPSPGEDGMDVTKDAPQQRAGGLKLGERKRRTIDLGQLDVAREYAMEPGGLPYVVEAALEVDLAIWLCDHAARLDTALRRHGAILFRGFRLGSADAFRRVQDVLCSDVIRGYGDLPEEKHTGRQVYKSTPYPQDRTILFHNESSHQADWPVRQFFACVTAAEWGGETPIVDCRRVAERLGDTIVDEFERRGLVYIRTFIDGLDVSWQDFFKTDDRGEVARACERAGDDHHWFDDGTLQVRHAAQAVAYHPLTGERTFFNQIQLHEPYFLGREERAALESMYGIDKLPRNVLYGDGTAIPPAILDAVLAAYQDLAVAFPWQAGDMLMLDNMLVAHARNPFRGDRKIIVGLGDPHSAMTRQTEDA